MNVETNSNNNNGSMKTIGVNALMLEVGSNHLEHYLNKNGGMMCSSPIHLPRHRKFVDISRGIEQVVSSSDFDSDNVGSSPAPPAKRSKL